MRGADARKRTDERLPAVIGQNAARLLVVLADTIVAPRKLYKFDDALQELTRRTSGRAENHHLETESKR